MDCKRHEIIVTFKNRYVNIENVYEDELIRKIHYNVILINGNYYIL